MTVASCERLCDPLRLALAEGVLVSEGVGLSVCEPDEDDDAVAEPLDVAEPLGVGDTVRVEEDVSEGVRDDDGVWERLPVPVTVCVRLRVTVRLGLCVPLGVGLHPRFTARSPNDP